MLDLIYDLLDRGGKRWRPVLGMIYAECLGRNVADAIMSAEMRAAEEYALGGLCDLFDDDGNGYWVECLV